jgi:predicted RNase H-like nuclease (RuvC/YqgF family)
MSRMSEERLAFLETVNSASPYGECTREIRALQGELADSKSDLARAERAISSAHAEAYELTVELRKDGEELDRLCRELAEARRNTALETYGDDWEERIKAFDILSTSADPRQRRLATILREHVKDIANPQELRTTIDAARESQ